MDVIKKMSLHSKFMKNPKKFRQSVKEYILEKIEYDHDEINVIIDILADAIVNVHNNGTMDIKNMFLVDTEEEEEIEDFEQYL